MAITRQIRTQAFGLLGTRVDTPPELVELLDIYRRADRLFVGDGIRSIHVVGGVWQRPAIRNAADRKHAQKIMQQFLSEAYAEHYTGKLYLQVWDGGRRVELNFS